MKFNQAKTGTGPAVKTFNLAGGEAYTVDNRTALYLTASTHLGGGQGDGYYQSAESKFSDLIALVQKVAKQDPEFIFQLAAYCRQDLYLRSIPTVLFIEGIRAMHANKAPGASYPVDASVYADLVFGRADEIVEAVAYWLANEGHHKLPSPLRKALNRALNNFDEYRLLKYNQDDKAVTFKDIVRLVHPEPKSEVQSAIFRYFVKDDVNAELMPKTAARKALLRLDKFDAEARNLIKASHATWETVTSKFGMSKEVLSAVLPNMGYMAKLRNFNNFIKVGIDLDPILEELASPEAVRKSKQLPFRFYSALKNVNISDPFVKQDVEEALAKALEVSVANVTSLTGPTLVAGDVSGSMQQALNGRSTVQYIEIGAIMAGIATAINPKSVASAFGTSFQTVPKGRTILQTAQNVLNANVGWSTNAYLILKYLLDNKILVNRIMYFTDTQCYGGSMNTLWEKYKTFARYQGVNPFLYEVNLAGGNTSNFKPQEQVAIIGGWSDKVFDLISVYESDPRSAVKKIKEKYTPSALVGV